MPLTGSLAETDFLSSAMQVSLSPACPSALCPESTRNTLLAALITFFHCTTHDFIALFQHSTLGFLKSEHCCWKFPISCQSHARPCYPWQQPHNCFQEKSCIFWNDNILNFWLSDSQFQHQPNPQLWFLCSNTQVTERTASLCQSHFYYIASPWQFSLLWFSFLSCSTSYFTLTPCLTSEYHALSACYPCTKAGWQFCKIKSKMIYCNKLNSY